MTTSRAARGRRERIPRLNATMACDAAFRVVARRYLADLMASHQGTSNGDPVALHQMRLALTHLRAAILFFSPMVADARQARTMVELKWLNAHLGKVRDLDVAIERLRAIGRRRQQAPYMTWTVKRADIHRHLLRALRSARYQRLIKSTSDWIDHGPWAIRKGKKSARGRAAPVAAYGVRKLTRWQNKLLNRSRNLSKMDAEKRHRLRLLNKKLYYSMDALADLFAGPKFSCHQTALKYLRKAQSSLGQLNDDAIGHSLAAALDGKDVRAFPQFLSRKSERRLLQTATTAYRKLAELQREK